MSLTMKLASQDMDDKIRRAVEFRKKHILKQNEPVSEEEFKNEKRKGRLTELAMIGGAGLGVGALGGYHFGLRKKRR